MDVIPHKHPPCDHLHQPLAKRNVYALLEVTYCLHKGLTPPPLLYGPTGVGVLSPPMLAGHAHKQSQGHADRRGPGKGGEKKQWHPLKHAHDGIFRKMLEDVRWRRVWRAETCHQSISITHHLRKRRQHVTKDTHTLNAKEER